MPLERRATASSAPKQAESIPGAFPDDHEQSTQRNPAFSLIRALKARKNEYIRPRKLKVRVGSWNVAAITGTELDLGDWFVADKADKSKLAPSNKDPKSPTTGQLKDLTNEADIAHEKQQQEDEPQEIDLYVLGLQEVVDINSPTEALRPFTDNSPALRWREAIQNSIPEYNLVSSQQMVGLLLLVYASPSLSPLVTSVDSCSIGTGLMGYMGNKGAVCTRIVVGGTTRLVFVNCHLAAGNDDASLSRRNWDAAQIASRIAFEPVREEDEIADEIVKPDATGNQTVKLGEEEFAFWFGDFNYRLQDIPGEDLRRLLHLHAQGKYRQQEQPSVSQLQNDTAFPRSSSDLPMPELFETNPDADGDIDSDSGADESQDLETDLDPSSDPASLKTTLASLLPHDQLRLQQAKKQAFQQGWHEGEISFLPTYKYDIGKTGVFDSSKKQRAPSWCDRILYRTREDWEAYVQKALEDEKKRRKDEELKQLGLGLDESNLQQNPKPRSEDDIIFDYDFESDDIVPPQRKPSDAEKAISQTDKKADVAGVTYDYDETEDAFSQDAASVADETARLITYRSFQDIVSSDHKPLLADFVLSIKSIDPELKNAIAREVARELDKAENEARPAITVVIDPVLPDPEESKLKDRGSSDSQGQQASRNADEQDIIRFGKLYYKAPKTRSMTIANTGGVDATFRFFDPSSQPGQDAESPFWLRIQPDGEAQKVSVSPAVYTLPPGAATTVTLTIEINDIDMLRTLNMSKEPCPEIEYVIVLRLKGGRDHFVPLSGIWMRTGVPIERPSISHQGMLPRHSTIPPNSSKQRGLTSRQLPEVSDETSSSGSSESESDSDSESEDEDDSESVSKSDQMSLSHDAPSSGDESDGDEREKGQITTVTGRQKPQIQRIGTSSLRDRLSAFLPALKAANEELEEKRGDKDIRLEVDDDDNEDGDSGNDGSRGQYIEMNLGLGVLKQKNGDETSSSGSDDSDSDVSEDARDTKKKKDVMQELMGTKSKNIKKPSIQEL